MEHGNLRVLMQPAELIIIGGAAGGTALIANPLHILKEIAGGLAGTFAVLGVVITMGRWVVRRRKSDTKW